MKMRARIVMKQAFGSSKKEHPVGLLLSGMFIVSCHRATRISGTGGARIERPGSSANYAEIPPVCMWRCTGTRRSVHKYRMYVGLRTNTSSFFGGFAGGWLGDVLC